MRVLGRDHEERFRQPVSRDVHAHLALLHRLEQRALRPRARAVHFIRQQQLGEDRTLAEIELLVGAVEDRHTDDV